MSYEYIRNETKIEVSKLGKKHLPYSRLKELSEDQYRMEDSEGKRIRRLHKKGEALDFFCQRYPDLKKSTEKWLEDCNRLLNGSESLFKELMRESFSERYSGIFIETETIKVLKSIFGGSFSFSTKEEDWSGTDGFIKGYEAQIKSGELPNKKAEEIMREGKLLIEVLYSFSYKGNRILVFNRNETVHLYQKEEIKRIIESYIPKNESDCKARHLIF